MGWVYKLKSIETESPPAACLRDLTLLYRTGGDPAKINPLVPVELVIDHSVQVDYFGTNSAVVKNVAKEYERNGERYAFLKWAQQSFDSFKLVPPRSGICHQVNLEYLGRGVIAEETDDGWLAYPDTLVGLDSHTTMIDALGVMGWGVGGIEAEAAMLGQPVSMLIPSVVGFKLSGTLPEGTTATDLVLTITEMLRQHGVVGKFVEFYGPGVGAVPLANRATIGNMSPEYGSTIAVFPIDEETTRYLRLTGRTEEQVALVERYANEKDRAAGAALELDESAVSAYQFLCGRQAKAGAVRVAGDQRVEHGVLQVRGDTGAVIVDLDTRDDAMADIADREVRDRAAAQRDRALAVESRGGVAHQVQERLHHLVAVEID